MDISKLDYADVIARVSRIREQCDEILMILVPDAGTDQCPHPPDKIVDESTMGEEEYRCTQCGRTQGTPFHSED